MNKKIKNLFLAGALVLGFAGMAVSCKDYQPDIDALDSRLTKVESALQDLQNVGGKKKELFLQKKTHLLLQKLEDVMLV